jgi:hypothetical protein
MKRVIAAIFTIGIAILIIVSSATFAAPQAATAPERSFYAYYYMWWGDSHWRDRLGSGYPYDGNWPFPGQLGSNGCIASANYPGSLLTDVPETGAYDQLTSNIMVTHVHQAASAGLKGFLLGWQGGGKAEQTPDDSGMSQRLERMTQAIAEQNRTTGSQFRYIMDYQTSGINQTPEQIINDLTYLVNRYGNDPNWEPINGRRQFLWMGAYRFPTTTLETIANRFRDRLFIIADERPSTWTSERAQHLDGATQYWSTQNPYSNPQSFSQVAAFAAKVRADGKRWFAPLAGGYNDELQDQGIGDPSNCVPRNNGETLRRVYDGNRSSNPDGWFVISWNEWVEHTYLEPSKRYGRQYLDELSRIITTDKSYSVYLPLVADGFETGTLAAWTSSKGVSVQNEQKRTGNYAAHANAINSVAYARKLLPSTTVDGYMRTYVNLLSQSDQFIVLRYRTANGASIAYLYLTKTGQIGVRNMYTGKSYLSTTKLGSGWHALEWRVTVNGAAGSTEAWLDGVHVNDISVTTNVGTTPIGDVQIGDTTNGKTFSILFDDVVFDTKLSDV